MPIPITENMFGTRVIRMCGFLNIKTLEEMSALGRQYFLKTVPNCGLIAIAEMEGILSKHNLKFSDVPLNTAKEETLRDKFAMCALQGLLSNPKLQQQIIEKGGARGGWIEESAWSWANSMMEIRKRGKDAKD